MNIIRQFPQYESAIKKKLITLHPAQRLFIDSVEQKGLTYGESEEFTFLYVGRNFYRKGGRETVEVLSELRNKYNFKLVLVSGMDKDEERYMRTDNDEENAYKLIESNKDWIEFHKGLPNDDVIRKAICCHVALLPTWMDTYGYSILETMACGTPTISTSLRALTEINTQDVGWLINVPVNKLNNPIHNTKEQQDKFCHILKQGLREKIEFVLTHRHEVKTKAENSLCKIRENHSPSVYAENLAMVYSGRINELGNL